MDKMMIRKVGVLSVAKIQAIILFAVSLIFAVPLGLFFIIFGLIGAGAGGDAGFAMAGGGIVMGLVYMIALPIMYAVIGFISGLIGALAYNLVAGMVGGIEIEVENTNMPQNAFRG